MALNAKGNRPTRALAPRGRKAIDSCMTACMGGTTFSCRVVKRRETKRCYLQLEGRRHPGRDSRLRRSRAGLSDLTYRSPGRDKRGWPSRATEEANPRGTEHSPLQTRSPHSLQEPHATRGNVALPYLILFDRKRTGVRIPATPPWCCDRMVRWLAATLLMPVRIRSAPPCLRTSAEEDRPPKPSVVSSNLTGDTLHPPLSLCHTGTPTTEEHPCADPNGLTRPEA